MIRWQWRWPRRSRSIAVPQAEQDWQHTFDAIPDAVALVAPDRTVMRTNRAATDALGLAPGALAGRPCYQALYGRGAVCPGCPLDHVLATRGKASLDNSHPATGALYEARLFPLLARAAADGSCAPRSILVTPQNFNPFVEGLSSLGADGMLPKPFNLAAVRTRLARVFADR